MLEITQRETTDHQHQVRELFWEYLSWGNTLAAVAFGTRFDIQAVLEQDKADLQKFAPPRGRLLLAYSDGQLAGCAGLRTIGLEIGELKRMYVRPQHRGHGIGRALVSAIIAEARQIGYTTLGLDSPPFSHAAHARYRAVGFTPIEPYPQSDISAALHPQWHVMELPLTGDAARGYIFAPRKGQCRSPRYEITAPIRKELTPHHSASALSTALHMPPPSERRLLSSPPAPALE